MFDECPFFFIECQKCGKIDEYSEAANEADDGETIKCSTCGNEIARVED